MSQPPIFPVFVLSCPYCHTVLDICTPVTTDNLIRCAGCNQLLELARGIVGYDLLPMDIDTAKPVIEPTRDGWSVRLGQLVIEKDTRDQALMVFVWVCENIRTLRASYKRTFPG